jgi:hypothetical protein
MCIWSWTITGRTRRQPSDAGWRGIRASTCTLTPTWATWLNLVERLFVAISERQTDGGLLPAVVCAPYHKIGLPLDRLDLSEVVCYEREFVLSAAHGCGGGDVRTIAGLTVVILGLVMALTAPSVAQAPPSIQIVSPPNGTSTVPGRITVRVEVRNFALNPGAIGAAVKGGEGHWHVYVDGRLAGMSAGDAIVVPNRTFTQLSAGWHVVKAQLVNNDHTPLPGARTSWTTVLRVPQPLAF